MMAAKVNDVSGSSSGSQSDKSKREDRQMIEAVAKHLTCNIVSIPEADTIEELDKIRDQIVMLKKMVTKSKRRWSELPNHLLELILKKVMPSEFDLMSFKYFLSFKAVCHSWRTAAKSYSSYAPLPHTPWLLHHPVDSVLVKATLFDPVGKELYTIKSIYNDLHKALCVGTSHGWMVMFHEDEFVDPSQSLGFLFNPISKATIQIPSYPSSNALMDISKGIISSNPSQNRNFIVVLTLIHDGGLAFYKHGDKSWGKLNDALGYTYYDILFHDDKLFASIHEPRVGGGHSHTNVLEIWDCREFIPVKLMNVRDTVIPERVISTHLAVSTAGEIVRMKSISVISRGSEPTDFVVEKLDLINNKWEEMHDLSNQSLFLYYDQLMSLSSPCFLGSERNSIYFAKPCICYCSPGQKIGTYNLEEKAMRGSEPFCSLVGKVHERLRVKLPPGWIVPNPW